MSAPIKLSVPGTGAQISEMIAEHEEYAFWKGQICGIEATDDPEFQFMRFRNADRMIEAAAYRDGKVVDAHPVLIDAVLVSVDGMEFPAKVWMDKAEAERARVGQ